MTHTVGPLPIFDLLLLGVTVVLLAGYGVTIVETRVARRRPRVRDTVERPATRDTSADRDGPAADEAPALDARDERSD